jgi:nitroreductase
LIAARNNVRAYKSDPVDDEKLLQVLEAARITPTADKSPRKERKPLVELLGYESWQRDSLNNKIG